MNIIDFLSAIGGCFYEVTSEYGLPLSLFIAGLVGSATHCVVMCGPFVISQAGHMTKLRDTALIPYHLGRMTTYILLAFLMYSVFSLVFVYSDLKTIIAAPMLLLAGVVFLVSAFPKSQALFPWVGNMRVFIPSKLINQISSEFLMGKPTIAKQYIVGLLLGFMPCGLVVAALIASSAAPSLLMAGMSMIAFTIGTMPALILVAIGSSSLKQKHPKFSLRFSQAAKLISALWLFALASTLIL